jgi:hypothetical protein
MFFFNVSGLVGVNSLFRENLACHVRHCASPLRRRLVMNWAHSSSQFKLSSHPWPLCASTYVVLTLGASSAAKAHLPEAITHELRGTWQDLESSSSSKE